MVERVRGGWRWLATLARLMVGVPDYEAYVARRRRYDAGASVMSRAAFVRHCAERRLGGRRQGGCC